MGDAPEQDSAASVPGAGPNGAPGEPTGPAYDPSAPPPPEPPTSAVTPPPPAPTQLNGSDQKADGGSGKRVDVVARVVGILGLLVAITVGAFQAENAIANKEANRRNAQAAVARIVEWNGAEASELWSVVEAFAQEHAEPLRTIARTTGPSDPHEPETRADAERLGSELQERLVKSPAQLNACRKLVLELGRLGEEILLNKDSVAPLLHDVQRELSRLTRTGVLYACILATNENETRVGYFVATYFLGAEPCDARPWLKFGSLDPRMNGVLEFAAVELTKCSEPEVNLPLHSMKIEGCNGVVSQLALFAPDSTMMHGAVTAAYLPPGPVTGSEDRLGCLKWQSEDGKGLIEMGAILNGGAFVRFATPFLRPLDIAVPATAVMRNAGEPLRFQVSWQFDVAPRDQGVEVIVNGARTWRPRYEPRAP